MIFSLSGKQYVKELLSVQGPESNRGHESVYLSFTGRPLAEGFFPLPAGEPPWTVRASPRYGRA